MGKFFNEKIRDMPSQEVKRLKRNTVVTVNRIYGQTKGYLEQLRKDYNEAEKPAPLYVSDKDKKKKNG